MDSLTHRMADSIREFVQWFDYCEAYEKENLVNGQTLQSASDNWDRLVMPSPPIYKMKEVLEEYRKELINENNNG